jgi:branched-chain amino acid transport system substrate-binding protein
MVEPEELDQIGDHDFTAQDPVILGALLQRDQEDDVTRLAAMELAVREINDGGGLGAARRLVMVSCDYDDDETLLRQSVDYLARGLGSATVIGPIPSVNTQRTIDFVVEQDLAVAVVSSTSTSTALTDYPDEGLLWRTSPNDEGQAAVLADLVDGAAVSKLAIVYINDTYGSALQEGVNAAVSSDTELFPYDNGDDFDALMQDVPTYDPDGMLLIAVRSENVIAIYEALVTAGLDATIDDHFLADSAKAEALLDEGLSTEVKGELAQALGTAPFHSEESHYDTFEVNLSNAGVDPTGTSFLAQSYDAAYLAGYGLAFAQAAPTPRLGFRVVEGFAQLVDGQAIDVGRTDWPAAVAALTDPDVTLEERKVDINGTGGPLDFDLATGDAPGNYEIWRVDGTSFTTCAVCLADQPCDLGGC